MVTRTPTTLRRTDTYFGLTLSGYLPGRLGEGGGRRRRSLRPSIPPLIDGVFFPPSSSTAQCWRACRFGG